MPIENTKYTESANIYTISLKSHLYFNIKSRLVLRSASPGQFHQEKAKHGLNGAYYYGGNLAPEVILSHGGTKHS